MQIAIKVLEKAIKEQNVEDYAERTGLNRFNGLGATADNISELQAAISNLKRKVKKDPRKDGLPELKGSGEYQRSDTFLIWTHPNQPPVFGHYASQQLFNSRNRITFWERHNREPYEPNLSTKEILFYCDPNDIT